MNRRDMIALIGSAAAWPVAARAQQHDRVRRLGMLIGGSADDPGWQRYTAAFREALAKLGWIDGVNLSIDLGFAAGDLDRARAAAAELVGLGPDVIFASSGFATRAAQQQTGAIPIVFAGPGLPSGENDARPAGNITGFPILYPSIAGKWVELLKEADPGVSRVALIDSPNTLPTATGSSYIRSIQQAAPALAVKTINAPFHKSTELERSIDAFATQPNGGLIVLPSAATSIRENRDLVRRVAESHRLPAIHWDGLYPAEGGLMSYGSNFEELHRRAASYVDRILRGAKVSELPVERPTKFDLVVNLKAAKAIGLTVPERFLLLADEVIE
jgi:putative ABC transport system substrate-binding protein